MQQKSKDISENAYKLLLGLQGLVCKGISPDVAMQHWYVECQPVGMKRSGLKIPSISDDTRALFLRLLHARDSIDPDAPNVSTRAYRNELWFLLNVLVIQTIDTAWHGEMLVDVIKLSDVINEKLIMLKPEGKVYAASFSAKSNESYRLVYEGV